jgi:hypothetical protein
MRWSVRWGSFAGRCLPILLVAALAGFPAQPVVAQDPPPPQPSPLTGRVESAVTFTPARPAAGQAVLYDQMDSGGGIYLSSQNSLDTWAADDFLVSTALHSWQINAVEVAGHFYAGAHTVNLVNVEFYSGGGSRPGYVVYSANVQPISGTAMSGNFYLPLSPAASLAANVEYWVSVQAIQSSSGSAWAWFERSALSNSAAMWKNPNNTSLTGCLDWIAIDVCFAGTGPDLLFRLYGAESGQVVPPPLFLPLVRR